MHPGVLALHHPPAHVDLAELEVREGVVGGELGGGAILVDPGSYITISYIQKLYPLSYILYPISHIPSTLAKTVEKLMQAGDQEA